MRKDPTIAQALRQLENESSTQHLEDGALAAQYKALWSTSTSPAQGPDNGSTLPPTVYGIRQQPSLKDRMRGLVISGWPAALLLSFLSILLIDLTGNYWSTSHIWGYLLLTPIVAPVVLWLLRALFGSSPQAQSSRKRRGLWCLIAPAVALSMSMLWQLLDHDRLLKLFLDLRSEPIPFSFKVLALLEELNRALSPINYVVAWLVGILIMMVTLAWSRRACAASPWLKPVPAKRWSRIAGLPIVVAGLSFLASYALLTVTGYGFFYLQFRAQASQADIDQLRVAFLERRVQREQEGLSRRPLSASEFLSKSYDPQVRELLLLIEQRAEQEQKLNFDLPPHAEFLESLLPHLQAVIHRPMSPHLLKQLIQLLDERLFPYYSSPSDPYNPQTQSRLLLLQLELLDRHRRELPLNQDAWPEIWRTISALEKLLQTAEIPTETLWELQQRLEPLRLNEKQLYAQLRLFMLDMLDTLEDPKRGGHEVFSEPSFDFHAPSDSVLAVARRAYQMQYWKTLTALLAAESTEQPVRFATVEELFEKAHLHPQLGLVPISSYAWLSLRIQLCLAAIELRRHPDAVNKVRAYDSRLVLSHKRIRYASAKPWNKRYIPSVTLP